MRGPEQTGKVGAGNTQWWLQFALRPWQLSRGPGGSSSCSPGLPAAAPTASGDWASHRQASGDWVKAGLGPRPPSHRDTHNSSSHTSSHGSKALRPYNTRPVRDGPATPALAHSPLILWEWRLGLRRCCTWPRACYPDAPAGTLARAEHTAHHPRGTGSNQDTKCFRSWFSEVTGYTSKTGSRRCKPQAPKYNQRQHRQMNFTS